jgi:hypothetical protein
VFGNNEGIVHGCHNCMASREISDGKAAQRV